MASTLRFLRQYLRPRADAVVASETSYERDGERLPATLYRPKRRTVPLPGWVLLHGLTFHGREHAALQRFAGAVASSGATVLVPEIPEWRALRVEPPITVATIRAAILTLDAHAETAPGRIGVIGFSFGATQALIAAADPRLDGHLRGVAAWGGYCDLYNLFRFGNTGEYELDGVAYRSEPDPYGRWIMGANYLTAVPGHEGDGPIADALLRLAIEAGRVGSFAWEPVYDPLKTELRAALRPDRRPIFDLFAPLAGRPVHDADLARELARELAAAALRTDPLLDPAPALESLAVRTLIAHGLDDRLIPFTESVLLHRALRPEASAGCTITGLFAHSGGTSRQLGPLGLPREAARFLGLLDRILDLI